MEDTLIKVNDHSKVKKEDVLLQAVRTGDFEKLDKLLSSGISIKAEYSGELLRVAVASGYVNCVEILINYGANLEEKNIFGYTALHLASQNGHNQCLKMLLEAGADCCVPIDMPICDTKTSYVKGTTALHLASKFNHVICVEELIRYGANCDAVDMKGRTSLYIAARAGNSECVLTLLRHAHSSSLSFPCYDTSDTPLHFAVKNGMLECVKQLVRLGCNVNHVNSQGFSPLHLICCSKVHMDKDIRMQILKILVLEGHNTDIRNVSRDILFQDCDAEMKAFLIAYGANINIRNEKDNLTLLEHELVCDRNLHLIKCIVNCMPQLPHLKSLNVHALSLPFPEENIIPESFILNDYVALRLLRGRKGMYIGINDSNMHTSQVLNFLIRVISFRGRYPSIRNKLVNGPGQVFPLRQPYLNLTYEHVNGELKKLEHVSPLASTMKNICDVGNLLLKDQLLKLKQNLWYEQMASTPRTLQHWCRFSIRECMGPSNLKHIKKLPLPERLLSYVSFECDE